jgi:hypothetical protein
MPVPNISPVKHIEYECQQSKYGDIVPSLPLRGMICAASFSGKSILIQNLILDVYRGCFSRIYIFSPTVHLDTVWRPVKDYITKDLRPKDDENMYFDDYDPEDLEKIIERQKKVTQYLKDKNEKKLLSILIVLDDLSENKEFLRGNRVLQALYTKGRHLSISTVISVQNYKSVSPMIRKNLTFLIVFKLRNQSDLDAILEEFSNVADKKQLQKIYELATEEKYSFLYIDFMKHNVNDIFKIKFEKKIIIKK